MHRQETAVLCSGGLDSAVLLAHEARRGIVQPLYLRAGLAWEAAEEAAVRRLLDASPFRVRVRTVVALAMHLNDVYPGAHWALRGTPPAYDSPDADVYLMGRNVGLLSKAAVYCAQQRIGRIALGPLAGNPFPDATPAFFEAMALALSLGLACKLEITAPFLSLSKADVVRLGIELGVPLEQTLSCMSPGAGHHCGRCSKCRERRDAFRQAGAVDRTWYEAPPDGVPGAPGGV